MLVQELLADLFVKGLPAIGAAGGGVYAFKQGGPWWKTLGLVAAGWGAGWGASRLLQWGIDRMVPGLPDQNTELVEAGTGYEGEAPEPVLTDPAQPAAVSGIRYINLEQEKARLRQEAIEKRRARRGQKVVPTGTTTETKSTALAIVPKGEAGVPSNVVPLAVKKGMVYGGLRVGKNVLGVSRPK